MNRSRNQKHRIAYVMTPITFGGGERVNLNFLKNVDRERYDIEPIMFLRPWEPENYFKNEVDKMGFHCFTIPVAKSNRRDYFRIGRCFIKLLDLVKSRSYDLLHTHGYQADLLGALVSKICKIPIISTCHGFIYDGKNLFIYNSLDCLVLRYFDRIITVSAPLRNELITKRISQDKIKVIENTPEVNNGHQNITRIRNQLRKEIGVESNAVLLGFIGRLSAEKGIVHLLKAVSILRESFQTIRLVIIGAGPQGNELKAIVDRYGLSSIVLFVGFQNNISEWLAAIDIFILPSLTEGTPMVLLEAMAQGVPCIASAVGGIPLVIHSEVDGILVAPGNPGEIVEAIRNLLKDETKRNLISSNAKQKIKRNYRIREWTEKIEMEYESLLGSSQKVSVKSF